MTMLAGATRRRLCGTAKRRTAAAPPTKVIRDRGSRGAAWERSRTKRGFTTGGYPAEGMRQTGTSCPHNEGRCEAEVRLSVVRNCWRGGGFWARCGTWGVVRVGCWVPFERAKGGSEWAREGATSRESLYMETPCGPTRTS